MEPPTTAADDYDGDGDNAVADFSGYRPLGSRLQASGFGKENRELLADF